MIRIDRTGAIVPPALHEEGGAGPKERKANVTSYANYLRALDEVPEGAEAPPPPKFKFSAYGRPEVRAALVALFHGKCAYCEKRFSATQPVAVEHWRPKGRVDVKGGRSEVGYFWLAADWDNLLPSCTDCNSWRYHDTPDAKEAVLQGKQNRFPVLAGTPRWTDPKAEPEEVPLLLHPYFDDPEDVLVVGREGVVRPRPELPEAAPGRPTNNQYGETSIEIYALNRIELVHERKALILRIERIKCTIVSLMRALAELPERGETEEATGKLARIRELLLHVIDQEMEGLVRLRSASSEFSAVARERIAGFLENLGRTEPGSPPQHDAPGSV